MYSRFGFAGRIRQLPLENRDWFSNLFFFVCVVVNPQMCLRGIVKFI